MNSTENTECVPTGNMLTESEGRHEQDTGRISGIYKIVNRVNGKYYVGSSANIGGKRGRWSEHRRLLTRNKHHNEHLQNAWNKYGEQNFEFLIIELLPPDIIVETEQRYLNIAKSENNNCYNLSFTSERPEMTERTLQLIRVRSPRYGSKNGMYGVHKFYGTPMKDKRGKLNPAYNHTIYHFVHKDENFTGTKREFSEKYHIQIQNIQLLINGKWKSTFGWEVKYV